MNGADLKDQLGIRDRAILETLYSTGIRRMELVHLRLYDLDVERGTLVVRQGKGKKDRMVPIGERALAWIDKYVTEVRPSLLVEPDEGFLFLIAWRRRRSAMRAPITCSGVATGRDRLGTVLVYWGKKMLDTNHTNQV